MASIGALTLSVVATTHQLRADLDKATAKIKEFERETKRSSASVETAFGKMDSGRLMAGKFAAGMALASSSLKTFGGASVAAEAKVLDGLARMAAGYAVGGPLGAGVVGITELIGYLAAEQDKAAASAKKWADEVKKANEGITKGILDDFDAVNKRIESITGAGKSPARKVAEEAERARRDLARISGTEDAAGRTLGSMSSLDEIDSDSKANADNLRLLFNQMQSLKTLIPLLDGQERRAAVAATLSDLQAEVGVLSQIAGLESDLAGERSNIATITRAITELETERAILARDTTDQGKDEVAELDKKIALQRQLLTATRSYNAEKANRDIVEQIRSMSGGGEDYARQIAEWTKDGASSGLIAAFKEAAAGKGFRDFTNAITSELRSSLSDAIYDAIVNGGRRGSDILQSLLQSVLKTTLDSIIRDVLAGAGGLFAGLFGGGGGAGGILSTVVGAIGGGGGGGGGSVLPLPLLDAG